MDQMTNRQYVTINGMSCPFCGSEKIEGGNRIEPTSDGASQLISCADCGKKWLDKYVLVGYVAV